MIYVATDDAGVSRYDLSNQSFDTSWNTTNGLSSNVIRSLLAHNNTVYVGTTDRLARFNLSNGSFGEELSTSNGLYDDHVLSLMVHDYKAL